MLHRKLIYASIFLLVTQQIRAQVSLQTGSAEFSIPILNWNDDKSRLNSELQLSYESHNGLLVDDVPSNVGQGWNLMAGGVITRIQVGQPDDQKPRDGDFNDIKKYPPGYLYNPTNISNGCPIELANYPIFGDQNTLYKDNNVVTADRELDYFAFEFNGRQGVFVLGKDNGDKGTTLGDSKLKIWFDRDESMPNTRTTITTFHIQDENGIEYVFSDKSYNKITRVHYANIDQWGTAHATGAPQFSADNIYYQADFDELGWDEKPYVVGSWYLSAIKDPLTGRQVTFNYNTFHISSPYGQTMVLIKPYGAATTRYITIATKFNITERPALASINYPDGHVITLTYGAARKDVLGDQALKSIRVEYMSRIVSQFDMKQSYMYRNAITDPAIPADGLKARLCLTSVQQTGVDGKDKEPPYRFDYYLGSNSTEDCVPDLFSPIKDIWGYYNGDANGTPTDGSISGYNQYVLLFFHPLPGTLPGNDQSLHCKPKAGYARNGLLKTVTYPMGGTITYAYDQNQAPTGSSFGAYYGGVHVSSVSLHDGVDAANDIVTTYNYTLTDGTSSLWGVETPICQMFPSTYFGPEGKHAKIGIPPCDYDSKYGGILATEDAIKPSELARFIKVLGAVDTYLLPFEIASVIAGSNPVFLLFDVTMGIVDCVSDQNYLWDHQVDYNYNLLATNLLPVQYKRVEVAKGTGSGKTVYEFTSADDYPIVVSDISSDFSSRQRAASWAYGLPKLTTVFDAAGNKVHQRENHYDFSKVMTTIDAAHSSSYTCYSIKRSSKGGGDWNTPSYYNTFTTTNVTNYTSDPAVKDQLTVDPYTVFTGRVELQTTYDRFFKDNDHFLEKSIGYQYSPNNYMTQKETTTLSNGDQMVKETYYTGDYTAVGVLQTLNSNNVINQPVATYHSVIKVNSSTPSLLSAEVSDFAPIATGDIRLSRVMVGRTSVPGSTYVFDPANPFNSSGLIQSLGFSYSSTGTLSDNVDEAGRHIGNLYDYNDKYLVASAQHAVSTQLAYTSFETGNGNGWAIGLNGTTPATYSTSSSMTGARSLDLGSVSGVTAAIGGIGKTSVLSFWSDGSVAVSGTVTLKKSAPTVNGYTYYEYEVASGSPLPRLTGSGHIDELRLYPSDSRMSTATYDIVLGKTSECDIDGRITYYEYDPIGRLRMERDENRNIVRMYEYSYKLPQ